ncbi:transport 122 homolog isoform X1 [Octopus vulgaris]|uniref:Intraflagellar transport protein 122 homolog n=2 Tax=Octopus TaxID=6643 RepID=A0AA36AMT2_OCTVU|nr:transport 122 homolog isoform X1 [Octopus vulgaris]
MRPICLWDLQHQDSVFDVCLKPDNSQLVAAVGQKVLVYNTADGNLIQPLKGHKDKVYCVDYAKDGQRFASGSADKCVIIWTSKLDGILKFNHSDAIQCLAYNPITHRLLSCAVTDFGLWGPEEKRVDKTKINSRITCASWTNDGLFMALGLFNGVVSIRSKTGEQKVRIERPDAHNNPIWGIAWNPSHSFTMYGKEEVYDVLVVADWGQKLSFYQLSGKQIGRDIKLGYDPCFIKWFHNGEYIICGGSDKQCSLYSKVGLKLDAIGNEETSWLTCCAVQVNSENIVTGSEEGNIRFYQVSMSTIHGLYKDRYAYRENMTDVIIQNLITNERVRIKCRDAVKKIAVYHQRLAVQLPDKIVIYELYSNEPNDMRYKVKEKIRKKIDCSLIVVTSQNIILCLDKRLQCLTLQGVKVREWDLESQMRYIKVIGGAIGQEGLLVGLRAGQIMKIFVNNPFPILLLKLSVGIRCVDLSASRTKLAAIDEQNTCLVYDLNNKELLFQEPAANSVAWNTEYEDMLCFSGNGYLNIKASNFPVHQQKLNGFVVGFSGSRIFTLKMNAITTIDVPLSAPMYQYVEKKLYLEACNIACLGVTDTDWDVLGQQSLEALDLDTAKKAFIHSQNYPYLELIQNIEDRRKCGETDNLVFLADIYAHKGKFQEAAKLYKKAGQEHRAMSMFSDLRMFDYAKEYIGSGAAADERQLISKQADWAKSSNEPKVAAEMYMAASEYTKAVQIMGEHGWSDMLIRLARKLDKTDQEILNLCGSYLMKMEKYSLAAEVYHKIGDIKSIINLWVKARQWDDAFALAEQHPKYKQDVYIPHAQYLAEADMFEEAQQAYHKAGLVDAAVKVLEQLAFNAVKKNRFCDAGFYFWKLSFQCLDIARDHPEKQREMLNKFHDYQRKAEMYYIYHNIHEYVEEPFTSHMPLTMFNMACYLWHLLQKESPLGISKVYTLYVLAKQSRQLQAYKLARYAYDKLQEMRIPVHLQESISLGSLMIRSKSFHDMEDLQPMCYRCSTTNPILNPKGNQCVNCQQPFVHSFINFEVLPLVEFMIEEDISDEEAVQILNHAIPLKKSEPVDKWKASLEGNSERLVFNDTDEEGQDPFIGRLLSIEQDGNDFKPIVVSRSILKNMTRSEVYVLEWPKPLRFQFFKTLLPDDVSIIKCLFCQKLFHTDDFELKYLQFGYCPFCREKHREG